MSFHNNKNIERDFGAIDTYFLAVLITRVAISSAIAKDKLFVVINADMLGQFVLL